jgi:O-acetylserine/cysteine efflux transporter
VANQRPTGTDLGLIVAVTLLWGFNFVPIRYALNEVPPFALASLRFVLAAIPMVFLVRRPKMPWRTIAFYGIAIGVGQFGLLFLGIRLGMPAGLASLVAQTQIFFTIYLGVLFLGEKVQPRHILGALIAGAGLLVLALPQLGNGARLTLTGFLLVVAAALCWAVGNIIAKHAARVHSADIFALVVWSSLAAPLPLAMLSYGMEGGPAPFLRIRDLSLIGWASVLFMSYGATLFGFGIWNRMLHRYPTAVVSPFALLIPIAGLASGVLFLGETLQLSEIVGALIVLLGLGVTMIASASTATPTAPPFPRVGT